jgi:hypothetical protein
MTYAEARRESGTVLLPTVVWLGVLIYLATAIVGVAVAYDPALAGLRLATLLSGFAFCGLLWLAGRLGWQGVFVAVGIGATALSLGLGVLARFASERDTAIVAGMIAFLLPLQTASVLALHRRGWRFVAEVLGACVLLSAWLLALTGERSTWLAVGIGAISAALYGGYTWGQWQVAQRWARRIWAGVLLLLAVGYVLYLVVPERIALSPLPSSAALAEHAEVWREMLGLAGDYRFTGSGLGMTAMVASSYLYLLHVPFFYHAHNTFVQTALEQGVYGVVGFVAFALATIGMAYTVRHVARLRLFAVCGLAAVVTVLVHGLLDAELYASALAPVLFVPFGYVWGVYALARSGRARPRDGSAALVRRALVAGAVGVSSALLVGLIWFALGGRSAWNANQGAVAQTRAELAVYHWPEWGLQDQVRRLPNVNLEPAFTAYRAALAEDAQNVTAHRRLGQIALSQGDYALAQEHLAAAYAVHPHDRAVRQLLGESYALAGDYSEAVRLWQAIDVSQGQLGLRRAWHEALDETQAAQNMQEAISGHERALALP